MKLRTWRDSIFLLIIGFLILVQRVRVRENVPNQNAGERRLGIHRKSLVSIFRGHNRHGWLSIVNFSSIRTAFESLQMIWIFLQVRSYTMIGSSRLKALYELCRRSDSSFIEGDIVECGVWNGGSGAILAQSSQNSPFPRNVWLFDSFQGLPNSTDKDGHRAQSYKGKCLGDPSKVREVMERLRIPKSRVHIIKGWFEETFPTVNIEKISLLHIDADWYESVKLCLESFYDNVQPGGFVVLDDYGTWPGCKRAVDEFIIENGLKIKLVKVDYTGRYFKKSFTPSA